MLTSFSEFKFYQSFRIPVEEADDLRFLAELENDLGKFDYIEDAKLVDISVTGLGLRTHARISVGTEVRISLQFKKHHLDLSGTVVRAFSDSIEDDDIVYGVEIDDDSNIHRFLEHYILSFSSERLKECLIDSALKERYTKASDGFEMFSLLLSLFKDITHFGDKEGFIDNMLEEVIRIMNAQRASIFLINPDTNELEAINALGIDKEKLKFDYRLGIAGQVFTSGMALNIDTVHEQTRFNSDFDRKFDFSTKSIIAHPIVNRDDKIIGVIEVINKRNQDRFTVEDEKTMKVLALVFSSVFHRYNPMSETSLIRRFSTPFDRENAMIGKCAHVSQLRSTIIKLKDIDDPILIYGEHGAGKLLYANIIHQEGKRGLRQLSEVKCETQDFDLLDKQLFGPSEDDCVFTSNPGGTVILHEVSKLGFDRQRKIMELFHAGGLQEGKVSIDVRIIATCSEDLGKLVDDGKFVKEFYELISKAYIYIEPLRRRTEDIELLVDYFLRRECKKQGFLLKSFSPKALEKMKNYDWPGNVAELKKAVERAVLYNPKAHVITEVAFDNNAAPLVDLSQKQRIFGDVPHVADFHIPLKDRVAMVEREMILAEIKRNNGNKSKAAKEMGISREALRKKLLQSEEVLEQVEGAPAEKKAA